MNPESSKNEFVLGMGLFLEPSGFLYFGESGIIAQIGRPALWERRDMNSVGFTSNWASDLMTFWAVPMMSM